MPLTAPNSQIVTDNDLLPLDRDVHGISQAVNVFREKDELVTRNIDKLLMQTMESLSRLFQEQKSAAYGGVSRQEVRDRGIRTS